jgi:Xaa-Pro aminopeptidase
MFAKSIKNDVELRGMRRCHVRDAAALCKYFLWLEDQHAAGHPVTEVTGAAQLAKFRAEGEHFVSLSFETISSVDSNAAIIHYNPNNGDQRPITADSMYLLDSGAQYLDGTTDVTRTMHFGTPSAKQKECFTRALKGHLALSNCVFPDHVTGQQLDVLARSALWQAGLDYNHGTGHGVGCFLNVHEGPHGISPRPNTNKLMAGAIVSNEPGYYEDGEFGIRIENLCYFKEVDTKYNTKRFLGMEDLTLVPIQKKLVDVELLTDAELDSLNAYHQRVLKEVSPMLANEERVLEWLKEACAPLNHVATGLSR